MGGKNKVKKLQNNPQYYINALKEKEHNWNELQEKLTAICIRHKNLMARQQQQYYCFNKNKIRIKLRLFLTLKQEWGLFLSLGLGNRNLFWYRDFLSRWEKLSWKMKNVLYFPNHDTLIRTLVSNLLLKLLQGLEKKQKTTKTEPGMLYLTRILYT